MNSSNSSEQLQNRNDHLAACVYCGETHELTDEGLCKFCADPDSTAEDELRERLDELVEEHDLPTVFWALDNVYDEFDVRMQDLE